MRYYKLILNSSIIGFLLSILAFQNTWLEMRINMAIIIPVSIVSIIISVLMLEKKEGFMIIDRINYQVTFTNIFFAVLWLDYCWE